MEWPTDKIFRLIDGYKKYPVLWDASDKFFRVLNRKITAWAELAKYVGCEDVDEVKKKMNSLLASYRRERHNEKYRKGGEGGEGGYRSTWFAYDCFDFLNDKYEPRKKKVKDNHAEVLNEDVSIPNDEDDSQPEPSPPETIPKIEKVETRYFSHLQAERFKSYVTPIRTDVLIKKPAVRRSAENCSKSHGSSSDKDEFSAYGEYVAVKLRCMDTRTRLMVQHAINNVLFEADLGKYNVPLEYVLQTSDSQPQQFMAPSQMSKHKDTEGGHNLENLRDVNMLS